MSDRILGNRYELESEIGRGGMGVVYKATDTQVKRTVAVKTLPSVMSHNQDLMRRFTSEVQHASNLEHPNIVRVYDVGEDDGTHFYVMQYIDGPDLRSQMKSKGRHSVDETISIISQVADALDYAHSQGIVHRDIKPENILLDSDSVAHVADFGIAKATEGTRTTRGMVGTPEYMSPEQVRGKSVDGRSDQYSLAVVAYEMLTGRTPFKTEGDDPWAQINMHLNTPVPNPRTTVPDLPTHVANALLQALAKKPEQRFGRCAEFVGALKGEIEALVPRETSDSTTSTRKRIAAAVVVCLLAIVAVSWLLGGGFRSAKQSQKSTPAKMVDQIAFVSTVAGVSRVTALTPGKNDKAVISLPFRAAKFDSWPMDVRMSGDGQTLLLMIARDIKSNWPDTDNTVFNVDVFVVRPHEQPRLIASGTDTDIELGGVSPDGSVAVYSDGDIHAVDTASRKDSTLTSGGSAIMPSLSPDGRTILYIEEERVRSITVDGSHRRIVTLAKGNYTYPVMASNGAVACLNGASLVLVNSSGRSKTVSLYGPHLTTHIKNSYGSRPCIDELGVPVFSRDGTKVVVTCYCIEKYGQVVYLIDTASCQKNAIFDTATTNLEISEAGLEVSGFAPSGQGLIVSATGGWEDSSYDGVFELDLSTHKLRQITVGTHPCWIRRPERDAMQASKASKAGPVVPDGVIGKATQISADFDGDGGPETAGYGATAVSAEFIVWFSKGEEVLWKTVEGGRQWVNLRAVDVTGDRHPELICVQACAYDPGIILTVRQFSSTQSKKVLDDGGALCYGDDWLIDSTHAPPAFVHLRPAKSCSSNPSRFVADYFTLQGAKLRATKKAVTRGRYDANADGLSEAKRELKISAPSLLEEP